VLDLLERELLAEQHFLAGRIDDAVQSLQRLTDGLPAGSEKGWYLQELARYTLAVSKVNANRLQLAAYQANRGLLAPPDGIKFVRLGPVSTKRVDAVRAWLAKFDSPEQMTIRVEECLGDMAFGVPANRFEAALHEVGAALGFAVQRPDDELKEGPDNLWALKDRCYLFAECKSDVDEARIEVARKEAGQMNTHCAWFEEKYPGCSVTRLLVHPGRKLAKGAHFTHDVALLRKKGLREFVRTVRAFAAEFKGLDLADLSERKVQEILEAHDLAGEDFMSRFTTNVASASEGE
jgi:hypothetical protein